MRVIFLQDVTNVANAGEIRNVSDGFARNYLIPKKLAALATSEELKRIERIKKAAEERRAREKQQWEEIARSLEGVAITVKAKVGPTGQFYGAITAPQIAEELTKVTGKEIDRRLLELPGPIREPGSYPVTLRLYSGIEATINVTAEGEQ